MKGMPAVNPGLCARNLYKSQKILFYKALIGGRFVAQAGVLTHSCAEGKTPAISLLRFLTN